MKIALISATYVSLKPIEKAIQRNAPDLEFFHLLDTSLLPMLKEEGKITPSIIQRFIKLIDLAQSSNVDAILFTCSAFNNIANMLQPMYDIRLYRSDQAMLKKASKYDRVGFVSTVAETPVALSTYLKTLNPEIHIKFIVKDGLIEYLQLGKKEEHDQEIRNMVEEVKDEVDVIVLSQYSIAHIKDQVSIDKPILTAPDTSIQLLVEDLRKHS